jgi:hypothetical protein
MKKLWVILSLLVLITLIPATAFAQTPTYYCSYTATTGNGSYTSPWPCANQTQLSDAVANVCAATTYGILYQIVSNGYYRHVVESNGTCVVTNTTFYYGFPPNTGIALPTPALLGIAAALGGLLIAGGYLFYRKRYA